MLFLSKNINCHQVRIKVLSLIISKKEAAFSFPFFKTRASLTVEAAIVLPLFLFYMMTILYTLEIVRFQSDIWEALHQVSTEDGFWAYEKYYGKKNTEISDATQRVHDYLRQQELPYLCVKDKEKGIEISKIQNYTEEGIIKMSAIYEVIPFIKCLPIGEILIEENCVMHEFIGYRGSGEDIVNRKPMYVYITPLGERYHYAEDCTYLKVQTMKADRKDMELLRNGSGEIYYECKMCTSTWQKTVFYTKWGNRYHGTTDCHALKKTIYIVPISEVKDRIVCTKCNKKVNRN